MKKLLYILASLGCLFIVAFLLAWWNLPTVGSYVLSRLAGGAVGIGRLDLSYTSGIVLARMGDVRVSGKVTGTARDIRLLLNLRKGLHFDHAAISGFTLSIPGIEKGKSKFSIIPTDFLEARDGVVTYQGQRFVVKELTAEHLGNGKPFHFRGEVSNDRWFGNLKMDAEGLVKGKYTVVKGRASVSRMDMGQWTKDMAGLVDAEGSFTYEGSKLALEGSFAVSGYELRITELKDPRFHETLRGTVILTYENKAVHVHARDIVFRGAPFTVDVELANLAVSRVEVSSGLLDMKDFERHLDLEKVEKGAARVWDYVKGGRVGIERIRYVAEGNRADTDLRVKDLHGAYKTWEVSGVEGSLHFDNRKFSLSGMSGVCKESSFKDLSGVYTFSDKTVKASASYSVSLKDAAPFVKAKDFSLLGGVTAGTVSLEGKAGGSFDYRGTGVLTDGEVLFRTMPLSLKGSYGFAKGYIAFEPLRISRDGTDMTITGSWSPEQAGFSLKGSLDAAHVDRMMPLPYKAGGVAAVDVRIERKDGSLKARGAVDMKDLSYEIPKVMTKGKGIANTVHFDVSREKDLLHITRLTCNLGAVDADIKGDIRGDRKMDLDVSLKIDGFEKVADIFFFSEAVTKGDAEAVMSLRGIDLKRRRVSSVKGYVHVNNGALKIPGFIKPLKEIRLKADFMGDSFDIRVDRLACGASVVNNAALHVEGLESPRFSLSLDAESLNFSDFRTESEFAVRRILPDNALARASGSLAINARKVGLSSLAGENMEVRGVMADRKLNLSEFRVDALGGRAALQGNVDFSGREPKFYATGKLDRIKGEDLLAAFDPRTEYLKGTWLAHGSMSTHGEKPGDMLKGMSGDLTLYSENGVIKRWNLLSKVLGLLNVYDLLRGKVDLAADGLAYTRMGASFVAKEGLFRTDNFIIDSPSMLVTGAGDVDFAKSEVDGNITVSPLVTIDSMVDLIPLVGRLLTRKKGGFLYVSYDVKGPLSDPEVKVRFVDTIGGKALGLIKNIITFPKEVFE